MLLVYLFDMKGFWGLERLGNLCAVILLESSKVEV